MCRNIRKLLLTSFVAMVMTGSALAADTTASFKVIGMECEVCQAKIQKALSKTRGVERAEVDLKSGSATVTYDDTKLTPDRIIKVIEKAGYNAKIQSNK